MVCANTSGFGAAVIESHRTECAALLDAADQQLRPQPDTSKPLVDQLAPIERSLRSLYRNILGRAAPTAHLTVMNYPRLFPDSTTMRTRSAVDGAQTRFYCPVAELSLGFVGIESSDVDRINHLERRLNQLIGWSMRNWPTVSPTLEPG